MMQDFELVELELEEMEKNKPNLGSGGYSAIGQPGGLTPLHVAGYDRGFFCEVGEGRRGVGSYLDHSPSHEGLEVVIPGICGQGLRMRKGNRKDCCLEVC